MRSFFIGLQFLTRLHFVSQTEWSEKDFGSSVKFFPLIGAVLGLIYACAAYIIYDISTRFGLIVPAHFGAAALIAIAFWMTGGIHCDGFMDTLDGLLSGRSRERMLEIMKDSCSGSMGVAGFVCIVLIMWSAIVDMPGVYIIPAVYASPIIGRLMMTVAVSCFKYARPNGIGLAFAKYADRKKLILAVITTLILLIPAGMGAYVALIVTSVIAFRFLDYATKMLGGVTGDIYGAVTVISETVVLIIYLFFFAYRIPLT